MKKTREMNLGRLHKFIQGSFCSIRLESVLLDARFTRYTVPVAHRVQQGVGAVEATTRVERSVVEVGLRPSSRAE